MIVVERDHKQTDDHYGIDSIILVIIAGVQCGWDLRRRNKIRLTASLEQGTKQTIQFCRSQQFWIGIIQPGVFFNCSSWFSEPKWNKWLSQQGTFDFGTAKKNTLYFWNSPTAVEDFMFVTIFAQQWSRIIYQRVNIYNFSSKYICQLHFQAVVAMVLSITKETENAGLEIVLEGCSYFLDHTFIITI